jgi:hypothetical protein
MDFKRLPANAACKGFNPETSCRQDGTPHTVSPSSFPTYARGENMLPPPSQTLHRQIYPQCRT